MVVRNKITGVPGLMMQLGGYSEVCTMHSDYYRGRFGQALAISGLRWWVGTVVFSLRGKPKNVRDASVKQLMSNQEF